MLVIDYLLIGGFVGIAIGILVLYLRLPSPKGKLGSLTNKDR